MAGLQLKPVLDGLPCEDLVPLPRGVIPLLWRVLLAEGHNAPIVIIPSNAVQLTRRLVNLEHRIQLVRRDRNAPVAAGVPG